MVLRCYKEVMQPKSTRLLLLDTLKIFSVIAFLLIWGKNDISTYLYIEIESQCFYLCIETENQFFFLREAAILINTP